MVLHVEGHELVHMHHNLLLSGHLSGAKATGYALFVGDRRHEVEGFLGCIFFSELLKDYSTLTQVYVLFNFLLASMASLVFNEVVGDRRALLSLSEALS